MKFDLIIGEHVNLDTVYMTFLLVKKLELPSAVILQLPPFYKNIKKVAIFERFNELRFSLLPKYRKLLHILIRELTNVLTRNYINKLRYSRLLKNMDLLLSVSKSIGYEMGGCWNHRIKVLKPSVAVDDIIKKLKRKVPDKKNYLVYYARLIPEKGLYEVPFIWRRFLRYAGEGYRLLIMGRFGSEQARRIFQILTKKLSVKDSIHALGYTERRFLLTTVAGAKALLYPSHVDAFPLVVLESLSLGTPVVSYDIPAIRFNYSNLDGVEIVPEFDVEAMAQKLSELIEKPHSFKGIEPPTWDQVTQTEVENIKQTLT